MVEEIGVTLQLRISKIDHSDTTMKTNLSENNISSIAEGSSTNEVE